MDTTKTENFPPLSIRSTAYFIHWVHILGNIALSVMLFAYDALDSIPTATIAPVAENALRIEPGNNETYKSSCEGVGIHDYEYPWCAMGIMPRLHTQENVDTMFWPGSSINSGYMFFITCLINALYSISFVYIDIDYRSLGKFMLSSGVLFYGVIMTIVALVQHGRALSLSSLLVGAGFFAYSFYTYSFANMQAEENIVDANNKKVTLFTRLWQKGKLMQLLLPKQMATLPLITYGLLNMIKPESLDHHINIYVALVVIMLMSWLILEQHVEIPVFDDQTTRPYNFRTEKFAFFFLAILNTALFMAVVGMMGDFWVYSHFKYGENHGLVHVFRTYVALIAIQAAVVLGTYAGDEIQISDKKLKDLRDAQFMPFMQRTANIRFVLALAGDIALNATVVAVFLHMNA